MKQRTHHQASFRLPEQIIHDTTLSPSAKQLAMVLFSLMARTGTASVSQRRLAGLSGLALSTVNQALPQLKKRGYLSVMKRKARFDQEKERYQGRTSVYSCCIPQKRYLLIPYSVLQKLRNRIIRCTDIPVLLYIRSRMNKGRAYPSLKKIARETGIAIRSVCTALKALCAAGLLYMERCVKRTGGFSCNSYFLLHGHVTTKAQSNHSHLGRGYCKFHNNRLKLKITRVLTREKGILYTRRFGKICAVVKPLHVSPCNHAGKRFVHSFQHCPSADRRRMKTLLASHHPKRRIKKILSLTCSIYRKRDSGYSNTWLPKLSPTREICPKVLNKKTRRFWRYKSRHSSRWL